MNEAHVIVKYRIRDYSIVKEPQLLIYLGKYLKKMEDFNLDQSTKISDFNKFFGIVLNMNVIINQLHDRFGYELSNHNSVPDALKDILRKNNIDPNLN